MSSSGSGSVNICNIYWWWMGDSRWPDRISSGFHRIIDPFVWPSKIICSLLDVILAMWFFLNLPHPDTFAFFQYLCLDGHPFFCVIFFNIFPKEGPRRINVGKLILFFYCHPDISNLLIIDSMTESSQNDYALNWHRPRTKTELMLVGKSSFCLREYGLFCLFINFHCVYMYEPTRTLIKNSFNINCCCLSYTP